MIKMNLFINNDYISYKRKSLYGIDAEKAMFKHSRNGYIAFRASISEIIINVIFDIKCKKKRDLIFSNILKESLKLFYGEKNIIPSVKLKYLMMNLISLDIFSLNFYEIHEKEMTRLMS